METSTSTATRQQIAEREAELSKMTDDQLQAVILDKCPTYRWLDWQTTLDDILDYEFDSDAVVRYLRGS